MSTNLVHYQIKAAAPTTLQHGALVSRWLALHPLTQAVNLGVAYYRMAIIQSTWDTTNPKKYRDSSMLEFSTAIADGLQVIINLNNQPSIDGKDFPTGTALTIYKNFVANVIDSCNHHGGHPYVVVVENEENNSVQFNDTTLTQCVSYAKEILAAKTICDTAGIICTNGGLIAHRLIQATYYNAVLTHPSSINTIKAWAYSVLPNNYYYGLTNTAIGSVPSGYARVSPTKIQAQIAIDDTLMHLYDSIDHLTYINMHWYEPTRAAFWNPILNNNQSPYVVDPTVGGSATDSEAVVPGGISPVISLLSTKFPGKTIFSNEVGQVNLSSCLSTSLCDLIKNYLTIGVLYDGDNFSDPNYGAKSYYSNTSTTAYIRRGTGNAVNTYIGSGGTTPLCH